MTVAEVAGPVFGGALVHIASLGIGSVLGAGLFPGAMRTSTRAERLLFSSVLGFVGLGAIAFGLASTGLLFRPVLVAVLAAGGLAAVWRSRRARSESNPTTAEGWVPLAISLAVFLVAAPSALYPVLVHDENAHHFLLPRLHLANHGFLRLPWSLFANMPHLVDLLNVYPMAVGDFLAARVMHLGVQALTAGVLAAAAARLAGPLAGAIGGVLYLSGNNVLWHIGLGHVEPFIGVFLLAATFALESWWATREPAYLALVGVGCGAALQSKYSSWFFAAAILAGVSWVVWRAGGPHRTRLARICVCGGLAAALALPWLIKSAILTGNPIYPNLYRVFGGEGWSAIQATQLSRSTEVPGGLDKTVWSYLLLPVRLVLDNGALFFCPTFSVSLMAAFFASLANPRTWKGSGAAVHAAAILGFAGWAASVQHGRFLVAWVPVLVLAACRVLLAMRGRPWALTVALAAAVALSGLQIVAQPFERRPVLDVFAQPRESLVRRNFAFADAEFVNRAMGTEGRILGLWENRFCFVARPFESDSAFEVPWALAQLRDLDDPDLYAGEIRKRGITHVVLNLRRLESYRGPRLHERIVDGRVYSEARFRRDMDLLAAFVERWLEPLPWRGEWAVYRLREMPAR